MKQEPAIRDVRCEVVRSSGLRGKGRYLTLHELEVRNESLGGALGPRYSYECVTRKYMDAVVLILHAEIDGQRCVCLRACLRPPLVMRDTAALAVPDERRFRWLWELPAGLIEPDEDRGLLGIAERASREAWEETGYAIAGERFELLPGAPFLSPGVLPERIHFALAEVTDVTDQSEAAGDGSAAEEGACVVWVPLDEALVLTEQGQIVDAKTELGLRRLWGRLGEARE